MHDATVQAVELAKARFDVANARKAVLEADLGRKLNCEFINISLLDLQTTSQYDIVWMEQAFHHLEPLAQVIEKVANLLRPGDHVVISEANSLNPMLQAQLFLQRGFKTLGHFEDETGRRYPYGNERILSANSLARLFSRKGIEKVSIEHFRVFPNSPIWDKLLGLELSVPEWMRPLFTHYNYVGRKSGQ